MPSDNEREDLVGEASEGEASEGVEVVEGQFSDTLSDDYTASDSDAQPPSGNGDEGDDEDSNGSSSR